ncbi:MAG: hypothetical protein DCF22_08670 [Leptolyngbya sp.]|nr:MAG: hypothetical protein DCF22_08670 [Leptolyngbya sp.]
MFKREISDKQTPSQDENIVSDQTSQARSLACYQPGGSKFFGPLENSAPLEAPKFIYQSPTKLSISSVENSSQLHSRSASSAPSRIESHDSSAQANLDLVSSSPDPAPSEAIAVSDANKLPLFGETISLLEERLVIDSHKRKIGEVVVRKEIETRIIEVPIRREKLVVEQVSPTYKQLAVVDLGQIQETEFDRVASTQTSAFDTSAHKFDDINAAIQFLEAIASESSSSQQTVHISIVPKDKTEKSFNS